MPCFSAEIRLGSIYEDYGTLVTCFPAWPPDVIRNLGRSERQYWVQFGQAMFERKEKRLADLITKLAERATQLLSPRRRK